MKEIGRHQFRFEKYFPVVSNRHPDMLSVKKSDEKEMYVY
jgi:hypothetical protein